MNPREERHPLVFPYVFTPEIVRPRYWRNRAEGRTLLSNLSNFLSYLRKYYNPKTSAPVEEVRYFDHQRELLRFLGAAPPPRADARVALVGDIMGLHRATSTFLDPSLLDHLNGFDAVLGNLETVVSGRFPIPSFLPDALTHNSNPALVTSFRRPDGRSTFTALSTANNHILDYGDAGGADTLDFLDSQGILHSGVRRNANDRSYVTFSAGGIRFGFYAACWGMNSAWLAKRSRLDISIQPGLAPRIEHPVELSALRQALTGMAEEHLDVKIVYLHWGHEYEYYPVPEQMRIGRDIIRAGADVVFGSHPHVMQPLEVCLLNGYEQRYRTAGRDLAALSRETGCVIDDGSGVPRKGLIAYSLGNFTTASFFTHTEIGMALGLHFFRDEASGCADWASPSIDLVYNIRGNPTYRRRRLLLLEQFRTERSLVGDDCSRLRPMIRFLYNHVLGSS
jgi:poly-gamma-glutamate capsule biosynthesis protein CapA/YwtB (metallophosphatase superfamily)